MTFPMFDAGRLRPALESFLLFASLPSRNSNLMATTSIGMGSFPTHGEKLEYTRSSNSTRTSNKNKLGLSNIITDFVHLFYASGNTLGHGKSYHEMSSQTFGKYKHVHTPPL